MPRGPRELSEQGLYHVIMRGAGKQVLFEDGRDYEVFLQMLRRALERFSLSVMAWCLMSNHVHLLVDDAKGELSGFAHLVSTTYARHFNERWGHVGHVFSSRFTSVAIGSDEQLLATMRYIHQNPSRAGMAATRGSARREWFSTCSEALPASASTLTMPRRHRTILGPRRGSPTRRL